MKEQGENPNWFDFGKLSLKDEGQNSTESPRARGRVDTDTTVDANLREEHRLGAIASVTNGIEDR